MNTMDTILVIGIVSFAIIFYFWIVDALRKFEKGGKLNGADLNLVKSK